MLYETINSLCNLRKECGGQIFWKIEGDDFVCFFKYLIFNVIYFLILSFSFKSYSFFVFFFFSVSEKLDIF